MTITATIARAKAEKARINTEHIRSIYAESLIKNFVEPAILEAASEGKTKVAICKGIFEDLHKKVISNIYETLVENGFTILVNNNYIYLTW